MRPGGVGREDVEALAAVSVLWQQEPQAHSQSQSHIALTPPDNRIPVLLLLLPAACHQFGDQEGVRGVFVALLELLKQKVRALGCNVFFYHAPGPLDMPDTPPTLHIKLDQHPALQGT